MSQRVQTAAVLGAGVMGTGIAAHLAGAGIKVHLMDIVPKDAPPDDPAARNAYAEGALKKALKAKPAVFFDPALTRMITPGNFDDHLDRLGECDLVIEAIIENLDIKKSLFSKVAKVLKDDAILASNTSGLSLAGMAEALPDDLKKRFLVLHFFNPVRYMHLLEIVAGEHTDPAVVERCAALGAHLGKGVVYGKDTPNFIANRIGTYGLMKTVDLMKQHELSIEEVDKIVGVPMGRPKSAAFQTVDIVGLDTFAHVAKNCYDSLTEDPHREVFALPAWITKLVESGRLGRKSGAGFYKKEGKDIKVLDVATGEYREQKKVRYDSIGATRNEEDPKKRLKIMINADDAGGKFAWAAFANTVAYAAQVLDEIADDIVQVDRAMRWGFNWDVGPFEAWDAVGVPDTVKRMKEDGIDVPAWVTDMLESGRTSFYDGEPGAVTYWDKAKKSAPPMDVDDKAIDLDAIRANKERIVARNLGAHLLDIGDGVACLEVHTKLNTIDDDVTNMLKTAVEEAEKNFDALVIGNQGQHFGAGANLMLIFMGAQQQQWDMIEGAVKTLQDNLQGLRYANIPVVAAPFQYTFGGCAEIAMAADACQAHAETYMGLVEVGVGLIPAGGGCLRMVERWTEDVQDVDGVDLLPFLGQASLNIAMAKVATGGMEAQRFRFLKPTDGISLNKSHLLYDAKQRALGMARAGYRKPMPRAIKAGGIDAAYTVGMRVWGLVEGGYASEHDALIAKKVVHVLTGGNVAAGTELTEQHYLDLEREAFLSLCGEEKSQARMQSMLMTNKPLRN
ncbi:MAG: 3-hydroxyacyl-CoA dehydrogenase/enoyl-CoA hydratase family protein [Deltaproteobacteria bacterium]|jgi:3-hydroxyacyl-CoA dehydrogenase